MKLKRVIAIMAVVLTLAASAPAAFVLLIQEKPLLRQLKIKIVRKTF